MPAKKKKVVEVVDISKTHVTKDRYEAVVNVLNEVLDRHNIDIIMKRNYRAKAGI